ncbi:MAG: histidinol-phosphate transaminase [Gammaproteobacteria bacterium]|nr:histidinol-phosphate transaminase [Gammaproteobacteria bacterium]
MSDIENRFLAMATPGVKGLKPYQPGKPLEELEREYGIRDAVKLASNENPLGPSPAVIHAVQSLLKDASRYPDGNGFKLKNALGKKYGLDAAQIVLGNGSSDAIEFVVRALVNPGDEVVFSQYSFAMYPILTQMVAGKAVVTPAKDWGHDLNAMSNAITKKTKVVFIANPNNPTGTWLAASDIESFLNNVPAEVVVVIDEAYFEYVSESSYDTAMDWLDRYPNLMVTRTFSKAFGLAGFRVGYGACHPDLANLLNRVRPPFNVNSLAMEAATIALKDESHLKKSISTNAEGMKSVCATFKKMGLNYIPSVGNFVCVDVGRSDIEVFEALLQKGVIVRPVSNYDMQNFIRVTIGAPQENGRFVNALKEVLG